MLSNRYRLRHHSDVQRVRQKGRRFRHPLAILLVSRSLEVIDGMDNSLAMNGRHPPRFAVVASRRVGSAVVRNRAKRLLREAIRPRINDIQPGWDGILIARPAIAGASLREVEEAVFALLIRARILAPLQLSS